MSRDASALHDRPTAQLVIVRGERRGQLIPLDGDVLIGRLSTNKLIIDDPAVSRVHARIVRQGARVLVEDIGSLAGTFVNGRRIEAPTALADGDEIVVGPMALVLCAASS